MTVKDKDTYVFYACESDMKMQMQSAGYKKTKEKKSSFTLKYNKLKLNSKKKNNSKTKKNKLQYKKTNFKKQLSN